MVVTAALNQVEMAAALTKAIRQGWLEEATARETWQDFLTHWPSFVRLPITALSMRRAAALIWKHDLRADDALHLVCTLLLQDLLAQETVFAYDKHLRHAAALEGLTLWPK